MSTRTRTTTQLNQLAASTVVTDQYNSVTGAYIRTTTTNNPAYGPNENNIGGKVDTITDELSYKRKYGYCLHQRTNTRLLRHSFVRKWTQTPDRYEAKYSDDALLYERFRTLTGQWCTVSVPVGTIDWAQLSYEAVRAMRPKFSDLSLANDLLELNQLKQLLSPLGRKGLRDGPVAGVSKAHLWYQFGVKPAIESLKGVIELMKTLPGAIRRLRENNNKVQTRHFARRMDIIALPATETTVYTDVNFNVKRKLQWKYFPRYTATMRFDYALAHLSDFELQMRAWLQASGLDNPLRVLWNAIPFSFVVDWFINVDKWVDSLLGEDVIPIRILDFCHSVRYEYWTQLFASYVGAFSGLQCVVREHSYYQRSRAVPKLTSDIEINMPSIPQVITGGALVGSSRRAKWAPPGLFALPVAQLGGNS